MGPARRKGSPCLWKPVSKLSQSVELSRSVEAQLTGIGSVLSVLSSWAEHYGVPSRRHQIRALSTQPAAQPCVLRDRWGDRLDWQDWGLSWGGWAWGLASVSRFPNCRRSGTDCLEALEYPVLWGHRPGRDKDKTFVVHQLHPWGLADGYLGFVGNWVPAKELRALCSLKHCLFNARKHLKEQWLEFSR